MLDDRTLNSLWIFVIVSAGIAGVVTTLGGIAMSFGIAFPITVALMAAVYCTLYDRHRPGRRWNRAVPIGLNAASLVAISAGAALIAFAFVGMPSMPSSKGQPAHHLNAYLDQGVCWAVLDRDAPVEAPVDFCTSFNKHFGAAFSGIWLFIGGIFSTQAFRRISASKPGTLLDD